MIVTAAPFPWLRAELERFRTRLKVPAVAAGMFSGNGPLIHEVLGVTRRGAGEPAALQDQWHIGSCGKSITAMLFARLVEKGICRWGMPVAECFPDLAHRVHPAWAHRTIDDVLHCRSGMAANPSASGMRAGISDPRPLTVQRSDVALAALARAPGPAGRFRYSNLGYVVVGAAIDRLSERSYEQTLADELLQPLGIRSLGFGPPPRIWGHGPQLQLGGLCLFRGPPADPAAPTSDNPRMFSAAGTLHLTLEDWSRLVRLAVAEDGLFAPGTIAHLLEVPPGRGMPMAMGWVEARDLAPGAFGMQGSNTMWVATALVNPLRRRACLVVVNDGRTRVLQQSARLAGRLLQRWPTSASEQ